MTSHQGQSIKNRRGTPCASNLVQFRLLFTKLWHFEKNGTRHLSLIGRHLESVSRTTRSVEVEVSSHFKFGERDGRRERERERQAPFSFPNYILIFNGVSATKVLWVEDDQNAIVKVPIRSLVTCDLDFLAPRRVTYALLQDEGG